MSSPIPVNPASHAIPDPEIVTVYGTTRCGDCHRTRRYLDGTKTPYRWIDLGHDDASRNLLHANGLLAVPVVVLPGGRYLVEPSDRELEAALTQA